MAGETIGLWTEFNNRKLAAERAKNDWNGNPIVPANDATITVKVADASTGPTAGSFTMSSVRDMNYGDISLSLPLVRVSYQAAAGTTFSFAIGILATRRSISS